MILRDFRQGDMEGEWAEGVGVIEIPDDSVKMTVVDDGKVVALGGAVVRDDVVFWMQVKTGVKNTVSLMRTIKESIGIIMETLGVERAKAIVKSEFALGHKTVKVLGFKSTGESMVYNNIIFDWYEIWHNYSY